MPYVIESDLIGDILTTEPYTDGGVTYGPYGWEYSYLFSFDGKTLKHLGVQIDFESSVTLLNVNV